FKRVMSAPLADDLICQVDHAVTLEGQHVVVKIQYPDIRRAIENDFRLFRTLSKPAQSSGHLPKSAIDEIEEQIIAETDYLREADNIEFLADRLAPLSFVKVPRVLRESSSDKVL